MSARAYVLLDIASGRCREAAVCLRAKPGVLLADPIEDPPGVMLVVEASEPVLLAELTIEALSAIEPMTEDMQLLRAGGD